MYALDNISPGGPDNSKVNSWLFSSTLAGSEAALVKERISFRNKWLTKCLAGSPGPFTVPRRHRIHNTRCGPSACRGRAPYIRAIRRQAKRSVGTNIALGQLPWGGLKHHDAELKRAAVIDHFACDRDDLGATVAAGEHNQCEQ